MDLAATLDFLAARAIAGLEEWDGESYSRGHDREGRGKPGHCHWLRDVLHQHAGGPVEGGRSARVCSGRALA